MIPVYQTIINFHTGDRPGNCLQACVASILEKRLDEVPHFLQEQFKYGIHHSYLIYNYCLQNGYELFAGRKPGYGEYNITIGKLYLDNRHYSHAVVVYGYEQIHDPIKDNTKKLNKIYYYINFRKLRSYFN